MILASLSQWDAAIQGWVSGFGAPLEDFFRLIIAAIAGGLIGLEREVRGRQAGFRTYLLVCVGSALVMIVSTQFAIHPWTAQSPNLGVNINIDPARIAYGVMTGIGFLGAGVIVHNKGAVRGLTTAAGLWCVASVGLAVGFGMYVLSILATLLILSALSILEYFEDSFLKLHFRTVTVRTRWRPGCVEAVIAKFKDSGLRVMDAGFRRSEDLRLVDLQIHVAFANRNQYYSFQRQLEGDQEFELIAAQEQ